LAERRIHDGTIGDARRARPNKKAWLRALFRAENTGRKQAILIREGARAMRLVRSQGDASALNPHDEPRSIARPDKNKPGGQVPPGTAREFQFPESTDLGGDVKP
jgi:hypothetical protein